MRKFPDRFPGSEASKLWPGAWCYGVDFAGESNRVIAVHFGGSDIKYGVSWVGPIELTEEAMPLLMRWAETELDVHGGYVHLFPADGDETRRFIEEETERESED
jgi:hypothetical protein